MTMYLLGALYAMILIAAANRELGRRRAVPLTALLTFGITDIDALWKGCHFVILRLSPLERARFERRNPLHRAAGLLLFALLAGNIPLLLRAAHDPNYGYFAADAGGILLTTASSALIYALLSALGAGWLARRDGRAALRRLGLRRPTMRDCVAGLGLGALIFAGMMVASALSRQLGFAQQPGARQLFDTLQASLPAALLVAILAAAGEEILFRGALQPIFGLTLSSAAFTATHAHYGLGADLLILFFVSLGFGLARRRYNTAVAILAHATYNFLPFLMRGLLP